MDGVSAPSSHRSLLTRRRLALIIVLVLLIGGALFALAAPLAQLAAARARWASQGISDYRIVAKYEIPFYQCQQDLEVHAEEITYRHQDECQTATTSPNSGFEPMIVSKLFGLVESALNNPTCGPKGCVCDGMVGIDVTYDEERGYPQHLAYRLMPELRWRYLEFWLAQLTGGASCPASPKNALPYVGEDITVISLTPLKPAKSGIDALPLETTTPEAEGAK